MVFKDGLFVVRMDGWVDKNIGGLDGLRLIIFFVSGTKFLFFSTDNFDYFFLDNNSKYSSLRTKFLFSGTQSRLFLSG